MRRDEYERSYGRRSHVPPPLPSPQEDPRSRRSRTKMKCLISIGLILPALAAVIGVAAWAVSADVVMNSGNSRGSGRVDNSLLQNYASDNDNRPDIFRMNGENQRFQPRPTPDTTTTSTSPTTTTTTTTTTTPAPPQTLSPKEATDVNAILSKLISASGAASGGNGPRFVVVAPLPDNAEVVNSPSSSISRVDQVNEPPKEQDLSASASFQSAKLVAAPPPPRAPTNFSNRGSLNNKESNRRMSEKPQAGSMPNTRRSGGFNTQIELTGFEPFDTMMQSESQMGGTMQQGPPDPPPGYAVGTAYKRGPPPSHSHFGSRNPPPMPQSQHFEHKEQHMFNHRPEASMQHGFKASHHHMMSPGIGLKPIQQQLHHVESHAGPLQTAESNRWGTVGFPGGGYIHKPPEGISIGISSPASSGTHVSAEPVSVIKSFFLPFLPKPRLNMNARVVFGVVLDKGMGLGAKKDAHHLG